LPKLRQQQLQHGTHNYKSVSYIYIKHTLTFIFHFIWKYLDTWCIFNRITKLCKRLAPIFEQTADQIYEFDIA